jgi:hypothetical protein
VPPLLLTDIDPPGSDEAALERVRRRVRIIKRRRALGAAAAALLVVAGGAVVAIRTVSGGGSQLQITAGASTTQPPPPSIVSSLVPQTTSPPTTAFGSADLASVDWASVHYPIDCGVGWGTKLLKVVMAAPDAAHRLAVVMAACDAGAGSPPRSIFVYDRADSAAIPHLSQTLAQDDPQHITGTLDATGANITTTGGTYSSTNLPRCCPDGTFTSRWTWNGHTYVPE